MDQTVAANQESVSADPSTKVDPPKLWWAVAQLTGLAMHVPINLLANPNRASASYSSAITLGVLAALISNGVYFLLKRAGVDAWKALAWVSVGTFFFWHVSGLTSGGIFGGAIGAVVIFALVMAAAGKFAHHRYFKVAVFASSVTLFVAVSIVSARVALSAPEPVVAIQNPIEFEEFTTKPDIYLLLFDGYGRSDVIDRIYGHDNRGFEESLEAEGFNVLTKAKANYPTTHFSVTSMLNMSYMHEGGGPISNTDLRDLAEMLSGDNRVVEILKDNGYRYVHAETMTQYNNCGPAVDVCISGGPMDITTYRLLEKTPIGPLLFPVSGDPTGAMNLDRIAMMENWSDYKADWPDQPTFTFLHLVLPHPPMSLDRNCDVRLDDALEGTVLNNPEIAPEDVPIRMDAWVEQVECANDTILSFLPNLSPDDVVIITSDHGPDIGYRVTDNGSTWDLSERVPTFTAIRAGDGCSDAIPENMPLVNAFRYVFACLSGVSPQPLEDETYLAFFSGWILDVPNPDEQGS